MQNKKNWDLEHILNNDTLEKLYKKWKNSIDFKLYNSKPKREATPNSIFDRQSEENEI